MNTIWNFLFGCGHRRTTFPQSTTRERTYVVCLDCGQEFRYDWKTMRMGEAASRRAKIAAMPSHSLPASGLGRRSVA